MSNCIPHDYCDYCAEQYYQIYKENPDVEKFEKENEDK